MSDHSFNIFPISLALLGTTLKESGLNARLRVDGKVSNFIMKKIHMWYTLQAHFLNEKII
jgi:hypothetical protein